jgi:hypothetical protein
VLYVQKWLYNYRKESFKKWKKQVNHEYRNPSVLGKPSNLVLDCKLLVLDNDVWNCPISFGSKKIIRLSIIAIVFAITVPIIGLVNSIGRAEGLNEFEHLLNQLQQGAIWSIYVITGYLYALVWWILFFLKSKNKQVGTL